jgi:hypothetical protein
MQSNPIQLTKSNEPVSSEMGDELENSIERRNEDDNTHSLSGPSGPMEDSSPSNQVSKLPDLMDEDGSGELCPLVLPGVARCSCQQITRAPAHRQRLPHPVPEECFR